MARHGAHSAMSHTSARSQEDVRPRTHSDSRRKKTLSDFFANALIIVGVLLMLAGAGYFGYSKWCYFQQDQTNARLAAFAKVSDEQEPASVEEERSLAPEVDWAGLKAINSDVVGWIQAPGTPINYPVYQASDNERYLRHNAEGQWTIGGQVFMDCDNAAPGLVDRQTVLYGHHLKDGSMFYHFFLLNEQEKFDEMKTVWYVTEKAAYALQPFFVYYTNPEDEGVRTFSFKDSGEFHEYLKKRLEKAVTKMDNAEAILPHISKVMTMSTCNYYEGYGRSEAVFVLKDEVRAAQK